MLKGTHKDIDIVLWGRFKPVDNGCMLWHGSVNKLGYGQIWYDGKFWLVHRLVFQLLHGDIPDGMGVCHHCDTPSCGAIVHLFLGTHADNMADKVSKNRSHSPAGVANGSAKLTDVDVLHIRQLCQEGFYTQKAIAEMYGISKHHVQVIYKRRSWAHI